MGAEEGERIDRLLSKLPEELATTGGVLAVWAESPDRAFTQRLRRAGFRAELSRPGRGGLRHAVYVATREERRGRT